MKSSPSCLGRGAGWEQTLLYCRIRTLGGQGAGVRTTPAPWTQGTDSLARYQPVSGSRHFFFLVFEEPC
ncbi:hypothetical protein ACRRTK_006400 [Alexandromys fortis]